MMKVGIAVVDITPPAGLKMAGFGARTEPAIGAHDALTVRAIAVNDTALAVVDVLGLHEAMSARIRGRCSLPAERVIISALHNHGGPCTMGERAGCADDPAYVKRLEDACVAAIDQAVAEQKPASLTIGMGPDPDVARNRRHANGTVDRAVPVLRVRDADGALMAIVTAYACHPVVLSADNRLWTADYPHFVRTTIEAAHPGAVAIFITACAGDANTGHSAYASQTLVASQNRTFAMAETLGRRIGEAVLAAPEAACGDRVAATDCTVDMKFERRETQPLPELANLWRSQAAADPERRVLLEHWVRWAEKWADVPMPPKWTGRVSAFDWGGVPVVALPGEMFAETGLSIRAALGNIPAFVFSYADSVPGYVPPAERVPVRRLRGRRSPPLHRLAGEFRAGCSRGRSTSRNRLGRAVEDLSSLGPPCAPVGAGYVRLTSQPVA